MVVKATVAGLFFYMYLSQQIKGNIFTMFTTSNSLTMLFAAY